MEVDQKILFDNENSNLLVDTGSVKHEIISKDEPSCKKFKPNENKKEELEKKENVFEENKETQEIIENLEKPKPSKDKKSEEEGKKLIGQIVEEIFNHKTLKQEIENIDGPKENEDEKSNEKEKANENDSDNDEDNMVHELPEEGFNYPLEYDASDMLDEVDDFNEDGEFPTVTERYFTRYYAIDVQKPGDDVCVLIHSNRICMITLAPSHPILQENKKIVKCNFKVSDKLDRLQNKVSGKAKRGAQALQRSSNLCSFVCDDGSSCFVKCCMVGKLVEVNELLVENPELLKKEAHNGGWIAIALPNLKHLDNLKQDLLTQEQYEEALKKRKMKINEDCMEVSEIVKIEYKDKKIEQQVINIDNSTKNEKKEQKAGVKTDELKQGKEKKE